MNRDTLDRAIRTIEALRENYDADRLVAEQRDEELSRVEAALRAERITLDDTRMPEVSMLAMEMYSGSYKGTQPLLT
jgi:hypothetical protein